MPPKRPQANSEARPDDTGNADGGNAADATERDGLRAVGNGLRDGAPAHQLRAAPFPRREKTAAHVPPGDPRKGPRLLLEHAETAHLREPRLSERHYVDTLLPARRAAYRAEIEAADVPEPLRQWAERMTARHGYAVRVWFNDLDWLSALMVVRYGEAVDKWPDGFDATFDVARAERWEKDPTGPGRPNGVRYLDELPVGGDIL